MGFAAPLLEHSSAQVREAAVQVVSLGLVVHSLGGALQPKQIKHRKDAGIKIPYFGATDLAREVDNEVASGTEAAIDLVADIRTVRQAIDSDLASIKPSMLKKVLSSIDMQIGHRHDGCLLNDFFPPNREGYRPLTAGGRQFVQYMHTTF